MEQRRLDDNGPQIPAIDFGAMGLSAFYGTPSSNGECFKIPDRTIQLGSTHIDSADGYSDNEDLLGKYFQKYPNQRQKVLLATKFGENMSCLLFTIRSRNVDRQISKYK